LTIFHLTFDIVDLHPLKPRIHDAPDLNRQYGFAELSIVQRSRARTGLGAPGISALVQFQFLLRTIVHFKPNLVRGLAVYDIPVDVIDLAGADLRPDSGLNVGRKLLKLNLIGVSGNEQRAAQKSYRSYSAFFHTYTTKHRFPAYRA